MIEFPTLPSYYTQLVDYVERAIDALDEHNHIRARELLIRGLREAEEVYISEGRDEE